MSLGSEIRKQRLIRQWTLEELSERSGVEVGTISALEIRDSTRSKFAVAIAGALGLSVDQLLNPTNTTAKARETNPTETAAEKPLWPFKRVTWQRYKHLIAALPPNARERAIIDIDSHLEILVEKWERELHHIQERKAA